MINIVLKGFWYPAIYSDWYPILLLESSLSSAFWNVLSYSVIRTYSVSDFEKCTTLFRYFSLLCYLELQSIYQYSSGFPHQYQTTKKCRPHSEFLGCTVCLLNYDLTGMVVHNRQALELFISYLYHHRCLCVCSRDASFHSLCRAFLSVPFTEQISQWLLPALAHSTTFPFLALLKALLPSNTQLYMSHDQDMETDSPIPVMDWTLRVEPSPWLLYAVLTLSNKHLGEWDITLNGLNLFLIIPCSFYGHASADFIFVDSWWWYMFWFSINSLWPGDDIWQHRSGSTLAQVSACCLMAPSHYLNQCSLIISEVFWHDVNPCHWCCITQRNWWIYNWLIMWSFYFRASQQCRPALLCHGIV